MSSHVVTRGYVGSRSYEVVRGPRASPNCPPTTSTTPTTPHIADGVTLCTSREEVSAAFKKLFNKKNRVGLINEAVLVQEFLDGGNTKPKTYLVQP